MKNVILFIVAAAALVVDANPSADHHSHIAALLRRQLPGSSTSTGSSGVSPFDPSSISSGAGTKCQSSCSPLTNNAVTACSEQITCLCSQSNYNDFAKCLECISPSNAQSVLSSYVTACQDAGYPISATGTASSNSGTTSPGTTSSNTNSSGSSSGDSSSGSGSGSGAASPVPTTASGPSTKSPAGVTSKSNGGVVGPNAFGDVGLSAVAAAVVMIATLGVSFV